MALAFQRLVNRSRKIIDREVQKHPPKSMKKNLKTFVPLQTEQQQRDNAEKKKELVVVNSISNKKLRKQSS